MPTTKTQLAIDGGSPVSPTFIPPITVKLADDEIEEAIHVLRSGALRDGSHCREFELQFATATSAKHALACTNGTVALQLAYEALIEPGDEVLCPGYTFIATASMLIARGAVPILCEVDERTFNIDINDARKRITEKTKAIAPVHLYGQPADIDAIRKLADEYGLKVIYDAAQSHLATYDQQGIGSFGDAVTYSFYPTKNMTTGEGGMVTVNDPDLADRLALIRDHGMEPGKRYHHIALGYNYRSHDLAAAIGLKQLEKLPARTRRRQEIAKCLTEQISEVQSLVRPPATDDKSEHVFHQYTVRLNLDQLSCDRDRFAQALKEEGVGSAVHYPKALTEQPVIQELLPDQPSLPICERLAQEVLCLPCHPALSDDEVDLIAEGVRKVAIVCAK